MNERLSIIIPTLNEEHAIAATLASVASLDGEVIVVDGGSGDRTITIASSMGAEVLHTAAGRGLQMKTGADIATGSTLLFLHADSRLTPRGCLALRSSLGDPGFLIGTFRLRFDREHPLYRLYAWTTRFDSLLTTFGDQGIVIRRELYDEIGGMRPWPVMEDVDLLRRARRMAKIVSLSGEVITSARRFERRGIVRQQLRNAALLLAWRLGVGPERIAAWYEREPAGHPSSPRAVSPVAQPLMGEYDYGNTYQRTRDEP